MCSFLLPLPGLKRVCYGLSKKLTFLFLCISYVNHLVSWLFRFFFYFLLNGCSVLQLFKSSKLFDLVNIFARLNKLFVSCVVTYVFCFVWLCKNSVFSSINIQYNTYNLLSNLLRNEDFPTGWNLSNFYANLFRWIYAIFWSVWNEIIQSYAFPWVNLNVV